MFSVTEGVFIMMKNGSGNSNKNKLNKKQRQRCSAMRNGILEFVDGVVGVVAKTALTYIIFRFFTHPDDLKSLGKDLRQFAPLFAAESLNASWQLFVISIRLFQLSNIICCVEENNYGCFFSNEDNATELLKDVIDRTVKCLGAMGVLIPTGSGVMTKKEVVYGNAAWFMASGVLALGHSVVDTCWDTYWKTMKTDMYRIVGDEKKVEQLGFTEKFCKILWQKFKAYGFSNLGAACLVAGLGCIAGGKVEVGTQFMKGSGVGFGASMLQQLVKTTFGVYKNYTSEEHPACCDDVFSFARFTLSNNSYDEI